ncbi:class I SAM-dependent methyltransferase [Amycolatopsis sp.]|uniref:class I SAM-dependent methyltransferase n=1 Tax=Amycolatopsis sp. TaxID=37632 RepID=UPI002BC01A16|nr:class I SAM-dependent methyltransferase [Amycolatopsis sp.]HVV12255.1 class I SAM-dependent methyltransferase [Amycolatopsis sp.]
MTEPPYLLAARTSYNAVADDYADFARLRFAKDVAGRALLGAFAELAPGPIADVGCGPGHVTAHLAGLGAEVSGIDLSPRMIALARGSYPGLRFEVGSMTALDLPDARLGGVLAWWSIFHMPPRVLPVVFAEFHRVLMPGGQVLLGFHVGDEVLRPESAYGRHVSYEAHLLRPERVAELLGMAGFKLTARMDLPGAKRPQACLLARKPGGDE